MAKLSRITLFRTIAAQYAERFGLAGWQIIVRWATAKDKKDQWDDDRYGDCTWSPEHQNATIRLDRKSNDEQLMHTIVHELQHILYEGHLPQPRKYDPLYELGINRMATAWMEALADEDGEVVVVLDENVK